VRSRLTVLALAAALGALSAPGLASGAKRQAAKPAKPAKPAKKTKKAKPKGPTASQIRAALAKAKHSPNLWATVNVCMSAPGQDTVGIRGQMPSLGFATTLTMDVSVSYWNNSTSMFDPVGATSTVSLGKGTKGIHQGGVSFPFAPPGTGSQYIVRGTVTFEWSLGSKLIGKVTRNTGHGYPNVAFSNPPGFSAGTCTLT